MRAWIVAASVLAACKEDTKPVPAVRLPAPTVDDAILVADAGPKPPFLVLIDDDGQARLAAAATWRDLDAGNIKISRAAPLWALARFVPFENTAGTIGTESIVRWNAEIPRVPALDPPPPIRQEVDYEDDESEYSPCDAACMHRLQSQWNDPQYKRQEVIDRARAVALGGDASAGAFETMYAGYRSTGLGTPARWAETAGVVVSGPRDVVAMLLVGPTANAMQLIELVRDTSYSIAVMHRGALRPLNIEFGIYGDDVSEWLEVRVSMNGLTVEAVPDRAFDVAEPRELAAALEKARVAHGIETAVPVDVLVEPDVDVQRFIDIVAAVDKAGIRVIGMGPVPTGEELARRGRRKAHIYLAQPNSQGDLDKRWIRRGLKLHIGQIRRCYEKELEQQPALAGTVSLQFIIGPTGEVRSSSGAGVSADVANCMAALVKGIRFPAPRGGDVIVNNSIVLRPQ